MSTHRPLFLAVCLFVLCIFSLTASADVVGPPPSSCPSGSTPSSSHAGPHCNPNTCTKDTDCEAGMTCQQVYRCVETTTYQGRDGQDYTSKNVTGTCAEGGSCATGDCQSVSVCISPSACGCQGLPSTHRPTMFLLLLIVLLALGVRKRRHPAS